MPRSLQSVQWENIFLCLREAKRDRTLGIVQIGKRHCKKKLSLSQTTFPNWFHLTGQGSCWSQSRQAIVRLGSPKQLGRVPGFVLDREIWTYILLIINKVNNVSVLYPIIQEDMWIRIVGYNTDTLSSMAWEWRWWCVANTKQWTTKFDFRSPPCHSCHSCLKVQWTTPANPFQCTT